MIKTIKEGKLPEEQELKGKCHNCNCEIQCQQKDTNYQSGSRNEAWYQVKCPTPGCGHSIIVDWISR